MSILAHYEGILELVGHFFLHHVDTPTLCGLLFF